MDYISSGVLSKCLTCVLLSQSVNMERNREPLNGLLLYLSYCELALQCVVVTAVCCE